jgi:type I restriction-modification system DNA methylase subunit
MSVKKLEFLKTDLDLILNDKIDIIIPKGKENEVDFNVRTALLKYYDNNDEIVKFNETGIKKIDKNIESVLGKSKGELDVLIFNYFNNNNIDVIIENKKVGANDDALPQAIMYANGLNNSKASNCRVVIGHVPTTKVRILVNKKWEELVINGKKVDYFFGTHLLKLIYDNPNENKFKLTELIEKPFAQKDLHLIINKLKTLYRQIPEILNNDELSINFTVSFIALKMIKEKENINWNSYTTPQNIIDAIETIIGVRADRDLKKKYYDIFIMRNKEEDIIFNFQNTLQNIHNREFNDETKPINSIIIKIHKELLAIPQKDLEVDLFGEVYETLASKKTKSALGEFFTRRHIIQPLVRMFLDDNDIVNIIENKNIVADIACGTGGFLTETFKYIKQECDLHYPDIDTSQLASEVIVGYDINHNNIGRTRINMILAGDGFSDIKRVNTLNSKELAKDLDYIITNIPYGKGDIAISDTKSKDLFLNSNNNKRLELNFLIKTIELLKKGGKALIIVPEGIMEAPTLAPLREYILKQCKINTIISLPKFSFAPYTKWKTYVIFIEKRKISLDNIENKKLESESIYTYIVDNDGFANSDKRFPTNLKAKDGSYLHNEMFSYIDTNGAKNISRIEQKYELKDEDESQIYLNEWNKKIEGKKYGYISLKDILNKKTIKHPKIKIDIVKNNLWNELNNQSILSDENYKILSINASVDKKGNYKKFTVANFIKNGELIKDFLSIFEELNFEYDMENNIYYDTSKEETTYALTLVPEKYLRTKKIKTISLKELSDFTVNIENEFKSLFGK